MLIRDIGYRQISDPELALEATLYSPALSGRYPAVICVHGGAWVSGDRNLMQRIGMALAERNIVAMAIDFRMGAKHPYPTALDDIQFAFHWLADHAEEYNVDPERIGLIGSSSGGHLALLTALHAMQSDAASNLPIRFVVTCSGVLDPLARYEMAKAAPFADIVACHDAYFGDTAQMTAARPLTLLADIGKGATLPPTLFFQGATDTRLPPDTAEQVATAYQQAGGQAKAVVYPATGHSVGEWSEPVFADMIEQTINLIKQL